MSSSTDNMQLGGNKFNNKSLNKSLGDFLARFAHVADRVVDAKFVPKDKPSRLSKGAVESKGSDEERGVKTPLEKEIEKVRKILRLIYVHRVLRCLIEEGKVSVKTIKLLWASWRKSAYEVRKDRLSTATMDFYMRAFLTTPLKGHAELRVKFMVAAGQESVAKSERFHERKAHGIISSEQQKKILSALRSKLGVSFKEFGAWLRTRTSPKIRQMVVATDLALRRELAADGVTCLEQAKHVVAKKLLTDHLATGATGMPSMVVVNLTHQEAALKRGLSGEEALSNSVTLVDDVSAEIADLVQTKRSKLCSDSLDWRIGKKLARRHLMDYAYSKRKALDGALDDILRQTREAHAKVGYARAVADVVSQSVPSDDDFPTPFWAKGVVESKGSDCDFLKAIKSSTPSKGSCFGNTIPKCNLKQRLEAQRLQYALRVAHINAEKRRVYLAEKRDKHAAKRTTLLEMIRKREVALSNLELRAETATGDKLIEINAKISKSKSRLSSAQAALAKFDETDDRLVNMVTEQAALIRKTDERLTEIGELGAEHTAELTAIDEFLSTGHFDDEALTRATELTALLTDIGQEYTQVHRQLAQYRNGLAILENDLEKWYNGEDLDDKDVVVEKAQIRMSHKVRRFEQDGSI